MIKFGPLLVQASMSLTWKHVHVDISTTFPRSMVAAMSMYGIHSTSPLLNLDSSGYMIPTSLQECGDLETIQKSLRNLGAEGLPIIQKEPSRSGFSEEIIAKGRENANKMIRKEKSLEKVDDISRQIDILTRHRDNLVILKAKANKHAEGRNISDLYDTEKELKRIKDALEQGLNNLMTLNDDY
jgi:hypothetical protein